MVEDLMRDRYNVIDKEIGYFCDTQQFQVIIYQDISDF